MSPPIANFELVPGVKLPREFFESYPLAVTLIREDGLVVWGNPSSAKMWAPLPAPRNVHMMDLEPKAFMQERVQLMRRLALAERSGVIRDLWQGKQILTHLRLLPRQQHDTLRFFLCVHEHMAGAQQPPGGATTEFYDPVYQDLGPLALLSARELEVLALVGEGLTALQIAARLHRSEETVNSHRAALLKKLKCQNAVQLAVIAHDAGLKFSDGDRLSMRRPSRQKIDLPSG